MSTDRVIGCVLLWACDWSATNGRHHAQMNAGLGRFAAVFVATALTLAACGGSASKGASPGVTTTASGIADGAVGAASAPDTAWGHVLDHVQSDGQVSVATALAAFALAIGPVPGAVVPPGASTPVESGTLAVSWVRARWAQLSAAQRAAVLTDLGTTVAPSAKERSQGDVAQVGLAAFGTGHHRPTPVDPNLECVPADSSGAGPYRAQVAGIESAIASHIGVPFTIPVYLEVNTRNVTTGAKDSALAYTIACDGAHYVPGTITGCVVHLEPRLLNDTATFSAADIHEALTHELMHCFLYQRFGMAYDLMPAWYLEGVPTWVADVLAGVDDDVTNGWWVTYLDTDSYPTFKRTYDALGFYTHLAETGTDPWTVIIAMGQAFIAGGYSNVAGWKAAGVTQNFLDSWGSGYAQGRYPGTAWATSGPELSNFAPKLPPAVPVGDSSAVGVRAPPAATSLHQLDITADVVEVGASSEASGRISLGGGDDATLDQTAGVNYCSLSSGCKCPPTSTNADATFTHIEPGTEYAAVTGGTQDATVTLTGMDLASFCNPPVKPINICTLMPTGTVSGIVGHPVGAASSYTGGLSPLSSTCRYGISEAIVVYTPDNVSWCHHFESVLAGGEGYRTVPGVGDHASYNEINGLLAFYGNTCIQTFNEYKIDRDFSLGADIALQQALRARL